MDLCKALTTPGERAAAMVREFLLRGNLWKPRAHRVARRRGQPEADRMKSVGW